MEGPLKMRPQTRRVSKSRVRFKLRNHRNQRIHRRYEWKGISKFSVLRAITEQNKYGIVDFYVNFKRKS